MDDELNDLIRQAAFELRTRIRQEQLEQMLNEMIPPELREVMRVHIQPLAIHHEVIKGNPQCPMCGYQPEMTTGIHAQGPEDGALCICGQCGELLQFVQENGAGIFSFKIAPPGMEDLMEPISRELWESHKRRRREREG
jgi:hypothetical protein